MTTAILPVTRFPTSKEVQTAMEMSDKKIESAQYLLTQLQKLAKQSKEANADKEKTENFLEVVRKFVDAVVFKMTASNQPWAGQLPAASEDINTFNNISKAAAEKLAEKEVTEVRLDYAVSMEGQYIRGYAGPDGESVDDDTVASLDRLFNAWLVDNGYAVENGYVHETGAGGEGLGAKLSADEVKALMKSGRYEAYLKDKGVNLIRIERDFPGEEAIEKLKEELVTAADQEEIVSHEAARGEEPAPDATSPSSTGGTH